MSFLPSLPCSVFADFALLSAPPCFAAILLECAIMPATCAKADAVRRHAAPRCRVARGAQRCRLFADARRHAYMCANIASIDARFSAFVAYACDERACHEAFRAAAADAFAYAIRLLLQMR